MLVKLLKLGKELTHSLKWLAGGKTRDGDDGRTRDGEEDKQLLHVLQLLVLLCVMYFDCLHSASLLPQNIDDDEDTCTRPPVASDMSEAARLGNGEEKVREVPAKKILSPPQFL